MPDYILVLLMVLSLLLPWIAILASLSFPFRRANSDVARIALATVGFVIFAAVHAVTVAYSYEVHSEWWMMGKTPLAAMYIPIVFGLIILTAVLEERIDEILRKRRR